MIIPFELWHFKSLKLRKFEIEQISIFESQSNNSILEIIKHYDAIGQAFTCMSNGVIIAVGGVIPFWPGTSEVWLFGSEFISSNSITLVKDCKKVLSQIDSTKQFHRIQCCVNEKIIENYRFATNFGFENEGVMKKFGVDGSNYIRLART